MSDRTSKIIQNDTKAVFKVFKSIPRMPKSLFGPNEIYESLRGEKKHHRGV